MIKRTCFLLFAAALLLFAGCSKPASLPTPSETTAETPSPMPVVPTPTATISATSQKSEGSLGVWQKCTSYGIHGTDAISYETYLEEVEQYTQPESTPDPDEKSEASKVKLIIGNWTYYFDTSKPVPNGEGFDQYPICRRNEAGVVENLGITGFEMLATPNYLYVNRNEVSGDFVHWDTIRVSLDGKEKIYVGESITLYIPSHGNYMYFTTYGYELYRTDYAFKNVEELTLDIPDRKEIEKTIDYENGVSGAELYNFSISDGWLYFSLDVINLEGGYYSGQYKMKLIGGKAVKTDKGEYDLFEGD